MSPHTMPRMPPDGLAQCCQPPQPDDIQNLLWNRCPGQILGQTPELRSVCFRFENHAKVVSGHPRRSTCCATPCITHILGEKVGVERKCGPSVFEEVVCKWFPGLPWVTFQGVTSRRQLSHLDQSLCPVRPGLQ